MGPEASAIAVAAIGALSAATAWVGRYLTEEIRYWRTKYDEAMNTQKESNQANAELVKLFPALHAENAELRRKLEGGSK